MCPWTGLGEERDGILNAMLLEGARYGQLCIARLITNRMDLAQGYRTL